MEEHGKKLNALNDRCLEKRSQRQTYLPKRGGKENHGGFKNRVKPLRPMKARLSALHLKKPIETRSGKKTLR